MSSLVCIGYDVDFDLEDGRDLRLPNSVSMLYDKTGAEWSRTSLLFTSFQRAERPAGPSRFADEWFGKECRKGCPLLEGTVRVPPRDLSQSWQEIGPVSRIYYTRGFNDFRTGAKHGGPYDHGFRDRNLLDVFTFCKVPPCPTLYRRGDAWRLEIGRWYVVTARGIVNA